MDESTLYGALALGIILNCVILYWIISNATKTDKKIAMEEAKIKLLVSIAKKLDVPSNEILEAIEKL